MEEKFFSKTNIVALIIGAPSLVLMALPWLGYSPPTKPINIWGHALNFLFLKIPLIEAIFGLSITFLITNILSKKPWVQKGNADILVSADDVEIYIHSEGEKIFLYLDGQIPKLKIWVRVINKSSVEINLDRISWSLHVGQFLKRETTVLSNSLKARQTKNRILIEATLSEAEFKALKNVEIDSKVQFYGNMSFFGNGKKLDKNFNYEEVSYSIDKQMIKQEILPDEQLWVLTILLNRDDCRCFEDEIEDAYQVILKKGTADFNILKSELQKLKLVYILPGLHPWWELTEKGKEIASKIHKATVNNKSGISQ